MKPLKSVTSWIPFAALSLCGLSIVFASLPEALTSFEVFSYQPGVLANRSMGRIESEESLTWLTNTKGLYYLQPVEESWSSISSEDLSKMLASQKVPGLDLTWEKSVDDARLMGILSPLPTPSILRVLYLEGTPVTDKSKDVIARQRNLRVLSLSDGMTDVSLQEFRQLPQLAELIVGNAKLTGKGFQEIGKIKTLRRLNLGTALQSGANVAGLAGLMLDQLRSGETFNDASLAAFGRMKSLGLLDLGRSTVTDAGLLTLLPLNRLHTLIAPRAMTDAGAQSLSRIKSLKRLDLSNTKVTDAGLRGLAALQSLEELSLAGTAVTDAGVDVLLSLPKLRMLDLSDAKLTSVGIKRLSGIHNLQVLAFSSRKSLTLADLKVFQGTPKLRTIIVNGKPASFAVVNYAKASGISPTGTALGFDGGGKAPWPDNTVVEALPTAQLVSRPRKGLSGSLYAMHAVESDLDHVIPAIATSKINTNTETEENFLGEFTVNAGSDKK